MHFNGSKKNQEQFNFSLEQEKGARTCHHCRLMMILNSSPMEDGELTLQPGRQEFRGSCSLAFAFFGHRKDQPWIG